jgi:hypothetical protein
MQRLQGQELEPQVILSMVSCFSICGFREGFVSHWLWDPVGAFWDPLIFLLHSS